MIYFAQAITGGPVKIGHSDDVPTRLKQLENHYGQPLALLATLPGGRLQEQVIHDRFSHLRFGRTEQFRPASDLMEFIGRPLLVGANPETIESMIPVESTLSIKLSADVVKTARIVSSLNDISMNDLLCGILRPVLKKMEDEGFEKRRQGRG